MLLPQFKDPLHQLPLPGGGSGWVAALKTGDVGLPFGLARKGGEACVVGHEIEVVDSVHDHEQPVLQAVDLHIQNADFSDSRLDFGPHMRMHRNILIDELRIVSKIEGLAIAFHLLLIINGIASSGNASRSRHTKAR